MLLRRNLLTHGLVGTLIPSLGILGDPEARRMTKAMLLILLVEDDSATRYVLRALLEAEHYRCIEADTVLEFADSLSELAIQGLYKF